MVRGRRRWLRHPGRRLSTRRGSGWLEIGDPPHRQPRQVGDTAAARRATVSARAPIEAAGPPRRVQFRVWPAVLRAAAAVRCSAAFVKTLLPAGVESGAVMPAFTGVQTEVDVDLAFAVYKPSPWIAARSRLRYQRAGIHVTKVCFTSTGKVSGHAPGQRSPVLPGDTTFSTMIDKGRNSYRMQKLGATLRGREDGTRGGTAGRTGRSHPRPIPRRTDRRSPPRLRRQGPPARDPCDAPGQRYASVCAHPLPERIRLPRTCPGRPHCRPDRVTADKARSLAASVLPAQTRHRVHHSREDRPATAPAEARWPRRPAAKVRPGGLPAAHADRALLQPAQGFHGIASYEAAVTLTSFLLRARSV